MGVCINRFHLTQDILRASTCSMVEFFPYSDHDGISFEYTTPPQHTETRPGIMETEHLYLGQTNLTKPDKILLDVLADSKTGLWKSKYLVG